LPACRRRTRMRDAADASSCSCRRSRRRRGRACRVGVGCRGPAGTGEVGGPGLGPRRRHRQLRRRVTRAARTGRARERAGLTRPRCRRRRSAPRSPTSSQHSSGRPRSVTGHDDRVDGDGGCRDIADAVSSPDKLSSSPVAAPVSAGRSVSRVRTPEHRWSSRRRAKRRGDGRRIEARGAIATWVRTDVTPPTTRELPWPKRWRVRRARRVVHSATSRHSSVVQPLDELSLDVWDDHVAVSLRGAICWGRGAAAPARGRGRLLLMTSPSGIEGSVALPAYGEVKGAIRGFTKSLAAQWGAEGGHRQLPLPLAVTPAWSAPNVENPALADRLAAAVPCRVGDASRMSRRSSSSCR